ncbi:MAG: DUF3489 domain-containing protein [Alphaproteobacteria bacterium]|nr:DUF3489 domain-containing protein [Alphaproteobacteria bacterium]
MTSLADLSMSQLAAAHQALSGIPTTAKSANSKSRAVARLEALLTEKGLSIVDAMRAAGLEQPEAESDSLEQDVAAAEASFSVPPEDDEPLSAAEFLASERVANDVHDILVRTLCNNGITADIAEQAALRAVRALPIPARARPRGATRPDGKLQTMINMMRTPEGATVSELATALNWAENSVRGAISGTLRKKLGLDVVSAKTPGENRVYRVAG